MFKYKCAGFVMALCIACLLPLAGIAQDCAPMTTVQLREKLVQMGFEVKNINEKAGEEKYSVNHPGSGFNVPVGYEISPSKNFIWLTANLGKVENVTPEKSLEMVKENAKIQPCFFYITAKGFVMMGLGVENRGVSTAILRRHIDKFVADVSKTSAVWQ